MSIAVTRKWIHEHKRKPDAEARWDGALELTRICAAEAKKQSGFNAANTYYNCRLGKRTPPGAFGLFIK